MSIPSHPSIDELRQAIQDKGGTAVCRECGREDFSMEEAAPMSAREGYGTHRLNKRVDLVCENCGYVMGYELNKLQADD